MKLSAPVYHLKRQARLMARAQNIPLHAALDKMASREGFPRWSLLAGRHAQESPASRLLAMLSPGELVLVGARPGHGKTLFSLELCIEAMERGQSATFYSLEYVERDILDRFRALGGSLTRITIESVEALGRFHGWVPARPVTQWAFEMG